MEVVLCLACKRNVYVKNAEDFFEHVKRHHPEVSSMYYDAELGKFRSDGKVIRIVIV